MSWDEAILSVLKEKQTAMHYRSIASVIIEQKLRPEDKLGATPAITVNSYLHGDKLKDLVISKGRGVYVLAEFQSVANSTTPLQTDCINDDCESEEDELEDALITAYGRFWDREMWEVNENKLYGASLETPKASVMDFTTHAGIYILHKGHMPIYVGQAVKLIDRLVAHTKDSKRNKWDSFSWFSITSIENHDVEENIKKTKSFLDESLLDTLEALLIEVLGPERNKKAGNQFEDKEFEQVDMTTYLQRKYVNKI